MANPGAGRAHLQSVAFSQPRPISFRPSKYQEEPGSLFPIILVAKALQVSSFLLPAKPRHGLQYSYAKALC